MKNELASNGIAEEIIRSFVQMGSAEMHLKTLYEKTVAELENGLVDEDHIKDHIEKADAYREDLIEAAQLRRRLMKTLFDRFKDADKDSWCMVKHLGLANMQAFESWQASDDDPELLEIAIDTNKLFIKYLTRFLGVEITACASCFADVLKSEEGE